MIKRILFVAGSGTTRAPMAAAIFMAAEGRGDITAESRGIVVQFPEPLNQKAEAVLISRGIHMDNFSSRPLLEEDFGEDVWVIAMESGQRSKILETFESATEENTHVLAALVGEELETMDPYGGPLQSYGLCYEMLKNSIEKLIVMLQKPGGTI